MGEALSLRTTLEARGPAAAVVLSDEQVARLAGGPRTPPVTVTVNGHTFAGRVGRMGGENLVGLNKAVRAAAGVEAGDTVDVVIVADAAPRDVEVPDDLARALADTGVTDAFAALAPSHRKEYVRWVEEAKKADTRARRVDETVTRVASGKPRR